MRSYDKEKKKPYVFIACCFFFTIIGFSFFSLLSQEFFNEILTRRSVNKETGDGSVSNMSFQVLSWSPRAFYLSNFATKQQCEAIINMAKPKLKPSTLALRIGETTDTTQNIRTSSGVFIDPDEDKSGILAAIQDKITLAIRIPITYHESFNILRYQLGQKYDSHYDAFNPPEHGHQKSQRLVSFLLYLSSVEEGGETMFPFERSLHGSCPVIKGEKWVATKWIRDRAYED